MTSLSVPTAPALAATAPPELLTDRLRLRPPTLADWPLYARFYTDGQASSGYGGPLTPRAAWARLASDIGQWALLGFGVWVVVRRSDGQALGTCGFWQAPGWPRELTWWLLPEARGQALALEASRAALQQAYQSWRWPRVQTYMPDANQAARALVERLGGVRVDRRVMPDGQARDLFDLPPPDGPNFLYFAYGSNMCSARLLARTPSAQSLGHAVLHDHGLRWHMRGRDGSGKCDVVPQAGEAVHGVLFRIAERDRPALDLAEGLGHAYDAVERPVQLMARQSHGPTMPGPAGEPECPAQQPAQAMVAVFYVALVTQPDALPFGWYHALVCSGAREHGLPAHYLQALSAQPVTADADAQRHALHLALAAKSGPDHAGLSS